MTTPTSRPVFVDDSGRRALAMRAIGKVTCVAIAAAASLVGLTLALPGDAAPTLLRAGSPEPTEGGAFAIDVRAGLDPPARRHVGCERVDGIVALDADLNGSHQPRKERAIAGALVDVVDRAGNRVSARTNSSGGYSVEVPEPGPVRVQVRGTRDQFIGSPVGRDLGPWVSFPTDGPDCTTATGALWSRWFDADEDGLAREIGDRVWLDLDGDGVQDPGEPGIAGVELQLVDVAGRELATTVTAPDGTYRFGGLAHDRSYAIVATQAAASLTRGPLAGLEPTEAWSGTDWYAGLPHPRNGADGTDSGHFTDQSDRPFLVVAADEPGASDHSHDLGFRPAAGRSDG